MLVNGRQQKEYRVCNNGQYNFLKRANGIEDLCIRFYSRWKPNEEYLIQVTGRTLNGKHVKLEVLGKSPDKHEPGTLGFRGHIPFRRPIPAFPFFHVRATFLPQRYKPFSIESVEVNGKPIADFRVLGSLYYNYSFGLKGKGYGSQDQIRNIEVYDGRITSDEGFCLDIPCRWKKGEQIRVTVIGQTDNGETQVLTTKADQAPWSAVGIEGWPYYRSLLVSETAGVDRSKEPVEVSMTFDNNHLSNPEKDLRIVTYYQYGASNEGEYVEIPFQILDTISNKEAISVLFVFPVDIHAYEDRVFVVCYGNHNAAPPMYNSGLEIRNSGAFQIVRTNQYLITLDSEGNINSFELRVSSEKEKKHKIETEGGIHRYKGIHSSQAGGIQPDLWDDHIAIVHTGPIEHSTTRLSALSSSKTISAQATYRFYADQPYVLSETTTEVKEDLFALAIQNSEIIFDRDSFDEFVWKDVSGKI